MRLWTPASLLPATLAAWHDVRDPATVTLNGATVAQIDDKSGNGRHLVQAAEANQPAFVESGINGFPVIEAPTASRWMLASYAEAAVMATGGYIFGVFKRIGGGNQLFSARRGDDPTPFLVADPNGFGITYRGNTTDFVAGPSLTQDTAAHVGVWGFRPGATAIRIDGTETTQAATTGATTINAFGVFGDAFAPGTGLAQAQMGEAVFCPINLEVTEIQQIEGYLAHRWGLQGGLPVDHPFRNGAPTIPSRPSGGFAYRYGYGA